MSTKFVSLPKLDGVWKPVCRAVVWTRAWKTKFCDFYWALCILLFASVFVQPCDCPEAKSQVHTDLCESRGGNRFRSRDV